MIEIVNIPDTHFFTGIIKGEHPQTWNTLCGTDIEIIRYTFGPFNFDIVFLVYNKDGVFWKQRVKKKSLRVRLKEKERKNTTFKHLYSDDFYVVIGEKNNKPCLIVTQRY